MAYIESHQELARHPKTAKLARFLGVSKVAVVGHLHFLWWWALDFAEDGRLDGFEAPEVADAAGWEGDAELFISSLLDSGFVDETDEGLALHDWWDYAGRFVDKRNATKEQRRKAGKARAQGAERSPNGRYASTPPADGQQASSDPPAADQQTPAKSTVSVPKPNLESTVPVLECGGSTEGGYGGEPSELSTEAPPPVDNSSRPPPRPPVNSQDNRDYAFGKLLVSLKTTYESVIGSRPTPTQVEALSFWAQRAPPAALEYAFGETARAPKPSLAFWETVLERLQSEGWSLEGIPPPEGFVDLDGLSEQYQRLKARYPDRDICPKCLWGFDDDHPGHREWCPVLEESP